MRPTAQEINAKLAHLADDSNELSNQLKQNQYDMAMLQVQLEYLPSPVVIETLKLDFPEEQLAVKFDNEVLVDDGNNEQYYVAERHGSAVFIAYTAKERVYMFTEKLIADANSMSGFIPTALSVFDSKKLETLRNELRDYVYGNASDSESPQQ